MTTKDYKVTVHADTLLEFPELWMEVFIVGDQYEQKAFAQMFARARCTKADSPEAADLVVFTGGDDVNPALYGEDKHHTTHFNSTRDAEDMDVYAKCLDLGIPMFGVCRGAQFLHVMNGGKLFQDVNNHTGDHAMYDIRAKRIIRKVSSVHHQSCIPSKALGMEVIADSTMADSRWANPSTQIKGKGTPMDVEAFFYRDTCCFGVQGHPEYRGYHEFMQWTLQKLEELVAHNPDIALIDRYRRLKPDFLAQRSEQWAANMKEDA